MAKLDQEITELKADIKNKTPMHPSLLDVYRKKIKNLQAEIEEYKEAEEEYLENYGKRRNKNNAIKIY